MNLHAQVVCSSLTSLELSGMAICKILGEIPSTGLTIDMSSMSGCSGGLINCKNSCNIDIGGMSTLNSGLKVNKNCDAKVNGMSKFSANIPVSGAMSLNANGMSNVDISGSATSTTI